MIDFFINGQKVDVKIENEKTVGEVLASFQQECEIQQAGVIEIVVNSKQITAEIFDEVCNEQLTENTKFEFTVVTKNEIKESFKNLSVLFENLSNEMENIPVKLQNGKITEVADSIKSLSDNIADFCHIANLASLFPETFAENKANRIDYKTFFQDFSQILLDFETALKDNDIVTIGDLSEYEICPRLKSISENLKQL